MHQITAVVRPVYEDGGEGLETRYVSDCGCDWVVDMRGRVRKVRVCHSCLSMPDVLWDQLAFDLNQASAADE